MYPVKLYKSGVSVAVFASGFALLLGLLAGPAAAQEAESPAVETAKGELGPPHVDGSFGFSVRPPAGCALFREKQIADGDVEVARFIHLPIQWSFSVRLSTTTRPLEAGEIIEGITRTLTVRSAGKYENIEMLRGEPARIAGREGVRYTASFRAESQDWLRQQAVIPSQPTEYFTLVFLTPLADRAVAEPLFEKIMASFEVLRDERARRRVQAALERGETLIRRIAEGELDIAERIVEDIHIRCLMEGQEVGFVRISQRATTLDHRRGVQIREWGWLFNLDGSITHLQHDMFLAADLSFERWENQLYILTPQSGGAPRTVLVDLENAIRQDDQLGVAYLPRPNAQKKRDKVFDVERSYASAALNVLLPRLVDLTTPEAYGFSTYKSERRGLALRTLEVAGATNLLLDGRRIPAVKLEDSEGLVAPKTEIYVDSSGRLLRLVAPPLEMLATTAQYVERNYNQKIAEAQALFKAHQPQAPAGPPAPRPAPESAVPRRLPETGQ